MKSVFSIANDSKFPAPTYELVVCFNGVPRTVVLEVHEITGWSGDSSGNSRAETKLHLRSCLKASEARAIASAILSAATESQAVHETL